MIDTETHCHCGAEYHDNDHCPDCGCEQYEGGCDHQHKPAVTTVYVLVINEPNEGGAVYGAYSTPELAEKAEQAANYIRGFEYPVILTVPLDQAPVMYNGRLA